MSISYKQDSKKLYKLTFMCFFFVFMFPREKTAFSQAFSTRGKKNEVSKHGCCYGC